MRLQKLFGWRLTAIYLTFAAVALFFLLRSGGDESERIAAERLAQGLLWPYTREAVNAFEIRYPTRSYRMERDGTTWRLTAPVEDFADSTDLNQMFATLEVQDVTRWLPPPTGAEQLAEFGLAQPRLELHFETKWGRDTLRFGAVNEIEKRLYMQASWADSLALVSTLLRTHWMKGRYELADKRALASADVNGLEAMEIANARGSFELVRTNWGWEIRRPERYLADDRAVDELIKHVWRPGIVDFIEQTPQGLAGSGLDRPRATLSVKLRGRTQPAVLQIGDAYHRLSYARDLGREAAFYLDSLTVAPLLESFSAFLSTVLASFTPGRVVKLENGAGESLLRDKEAKWAWRDAQGREADGNAVALLLNRLMQIPTERVDALLPRQDQIRLWGLDRPELVTRLYFEGVERALELEFGPEKEGRVHFRRLDFPTVFSLSAGDLGLEWPASPPAQK